MSNTPSFFDSPEVAMWKMAKRSHEPSTRHNNMKTVRCVECGEVVGTTHEHDGKDYRCEGCE